MWILKLVLFFTSVLNSFQGETVHSKNSIIEKVLKATLNITLHPEAGLNIYQVLKKYGYEVETHKVTTEDGYVLRMQRIPRGRQETDNGKSKPAVLLMHGMSGSSTDWLVMGPNKSLAYMLADAGFDVWLGNNRGNFWSRSHVLLDPDADRKRFWDFSFEECGRYDLPAKIDFIMETTGQKKIFYIGHSQGNTQYFAMASLRPQYNEKIALMLALAPSTYLGNSKSLIARTAAPFIDIIAALMNALNVHEVFEHSQLSALVAILACSDGSPLQGICVSIILILFGFNGPEMDRSRLPVLVSNAPAGIAFKMLTHYAQGVNSDWQWTNNFKERSLFFDFRSSPLNSNTIKEPFLGYFRQFDYGRRTNLIKYKSSVPPNFNLSAVTSPVTLYYSRNDVFAALADVDKLASRLPNVVKKKIINYKLFNHLDFVFAKHCRELINDEILNQLMKFNNSMHISTTSTKD